MYGVDGGLGGDSVRPLSQLVLIIFGFIFLENLVK